MTQNKHKKLRNKIVGTFVKQLKESRFYENFFLASLNKCIDSLGGERQIGSIICYGLGSFCNGVDIASRYQLALLILIYQHLFKSDIQLEDCIEVFDPSFEPLDEAILLSFKSPSFKLIKENEFCARDLHDESANHNKVTLVYMPHLDKFFYNNLLGANWTQAGLSSLVVLGNSFQEMIDNEVTKSKFKSELYYINTLVHDLSNDKSNEQKEGERALIEIKIDDSSFDHADIFNNFAFNLVDNVWLQNNSNKVNRYRLKHWQRFIDSLDESQKDVGLDDDWKFRR